MKKNSFYPLLLPVFFVLHGYNDNYDLIPASDAGTLFLYYVIALNVLGTLAYLFYRDLNRGLFFAFICMCIYFFFGSFYDAIKKIPIISRYSVLLALIALLIVFLAIWLKKKKTSLQRIILYLNVLFMVLVAWEIVSLSRNLLKPNIHNLYNQNTYRPCDSCAKPDIFLIVADEYAGDKELKEIMNFDNSAFENDLRSRGFHIAQNTRSNYNYTPYSITSMLNMNYIAKPKNMSTEQFEFYCYKLMNDNPVIDFLKLNGYRFYNNSVFDFDDSHSDKPYHSIRTAESLITAQTMFNYLERDFWVRFVKRVNWKSETDRIAYHNLRLTEEIYNNAMLIAAKRDSQPRFVYTHFMMPHYPYFFDSKGQPQPKDSVLSREFQHNKQAYVENLQYTNKKLLTLIDQIKTNAAKPPIIMLMGDHGFRELTGHEDIEYHFMNLNTVLIPDSNYKGFYDGMSNVNQFRVLFNSVFGQQLPVLKDSIIKPIFEK